MAPACRLSGLSAGLGTVSMTGAGSSLSIDGTNYTVDSSFTVTDGQTLSLLGTWSLGEGVTINVDHADAGAGQHQQPGRHQSYGFDARRHGLVHRRTTSAVARRDNQLGHRPGRAAG